MVFWLTLLQDLRDTSHYVLSEMEALDQEQFRIDKQASQLEQNLRQAMDSGLPSFFFSDDLSIPVFYNYKYQ